MYAKQPLQCQNQCKSTYHIKYSRSNIKFLEFSRFFRRVGTLQIYRHNWFPRTTNLAAKSIEAVISKELETADEASVGVTARDL